MAQLAAAWTARSVLGAILIVAAGAKLADLAAFRDGLAVLMGGRRKPHSVALAAWAVPIIELAAGLMTVLGSAAAAVNTLDSGIVLVFGLVLIRGRRTTQPVQCRCFGALSDVGFGRAAVARLLLLVALVGAQWAAGGIVTPIATPPFAALAVLGFGMLALVAGQASASVARLREFSG